MTLEYQIVIGGVRDTSSVVYGIITSPLILEIILPLALVFAVIYGVLYKTNPFGTEEEKPLDLYMLISITTALIAIAAKQILGLLIYEFIPLFAVLIVAVFLSSAMVGWVQAAFNIDQHAILGKIIVWLFTTGFTAVVFFLLTGIFAGKRVYGELTSAISAAILQAGKTWALLLYTVPLVVIMIFIVYIVLYSIRSIKAKK